MIYGVRSGSVKKKRHRPSYQILFQVYSTVYCTEDNVDKQNRHHSHVTSTPNGSRTRAACLEGKHDNRFTIGVTSSCRTIRNNTAEVSELFGSIKYSVQWLVTKRRYNPQVRRRYRPPTSFSASFATHALFCRCSSAARSLIFSTACVSGNPMSQYPGGVGARSHCARCRDTACRCALTPAA